MDKNTYHYPDQKAYDFVLTELEKRGITIDNVAAIAFDMQLPHNHKLTLIECQAEAENILHKREFLNNAMVGLTLDNLANANQLPEPLQSIVAHDVGVFGVDENLALSIAQLYGTIGVSSYGFIDISKHGIIKHLDEDETQINTFVDDIVGAWASAVSAKIAHNHA